MNAKLPEQTRVERKAATTLRIDAVLNPHADVSRALRIEGKFYPATGVQAMLEALIQRSSQKAVATRLGFSPQYINDVMRGRREISAELARKLGLRKIVMFQIEEVKND